MHRKSIHCVLLLAAGGFLVSGCSCSNDSTAHSIDGTAGVAAHQHEASQRTQLLHEELARTLKEGQMTLTAGVAHVDASSGNLCWPALTCTLPDCPSHNAVEQPYLFPYKLEGTTIDADGAIDWGAGGSDRDKWSYCPVCGQKEGVRKYQPPEVVDRKTELTEELAVSRAAHKKARRAGQRHPTDYRTPQQIMDELAALPVVFLIDDGRFDAHHK